MLYYKYHRTRCLCKSLSIELRNYFKWFQYMNLGEEKKLLLDDEIVDFYHYWSKWRDDCYIYYTLCYNLCRSWIDYQKQKSEKNWFFPWLWTDQSVSLFLLNIGDQNLKYSILLEWVITSRLREWNWLRRYRDLGVLNTCLVQFFIWL